MPRTAIVIALASLSLATAQPPAAASPATLALGSRPTAARVIVDGQPRGQTPLNLQLTPGRYEVRFEFDGHAPRTKTFEIPARSTVAHYQLLLPITPYPDWLRHDNLVELEPEPTFVAVGCSRPITNLELAQVSARNAARQKLRNVFEVIRHRIVDPVVKAAEKAQRSQPDVIILTGGYNRPFDPGRMNASSTLTDWRYADVKINCAKVEMKVQTLIDAINTKGFYGRAKESIAEWLINLTRAWASGEDFEGPWPHPFPEVAPTPADHPSP